MGLDMCLERMPRYKEATANDVSAVESYLSWAKAKEANSEYAQGTFEDWCGIKETPCKEYIDFYSKYNTLKYCPWDTEKKSPYSMIIERVGYWRKANAIHKWFVENIQDGNDDCQYHNEITKEALEELLNICNRVLDSCELVPTKVESGYHINKNGDRLYKYTDGFAVEDISVASELLPTQSGFFFGGTGYDEWYVEDIKNTIEIINTVLETTDFEKQMVYYCSSW